jgi:hypothetical protein
MIGLPLVVHTLTLGIVANAVNSVVPLPYMVKQYPSIVCDEWSLTFTF